MKLSAHNATHLDKAIAADPTLADAYISRGFSHGKLGPNNRELLEHSLSDYVKAIALTPEEPHGYNNRVELNPEDADPFATRGDAWLLQKNYTKAIKDYDSAIELNPTPADCFHDIDAIKAKRAEAKKTL